MDLVDKRIAITGLTGQVGRPIARALAANNEVIGLARFADAQARAELEAEGVQCCPVNLIEADFRDVPTDVDVVLNFAVLKVGKWDKDLAGNAEAVGHLMSHFRTASAFLHCSSTAVYRPQGPKPLTESDPLGDHHQHAMPTYSISKIAAECVARFAAREFELPTTIARLNVPYGDAGGWPWFHLEMLLSEQPIVVHDDGSLYNPIHDDDILADLPHLLDLASTPAHTINWSGDETVSIEEWSTYMGELVGKTPIIESTSHAIPSAAIDSDAQEASLPKRTVGWRDGFRRLVAGTHPEILLP